MTFIGINPSALHTQNSNTNTIRTVLIQLVMCRSVINGWSVKKIDETNFELTKKTSTLDNDNFELLDFITKLVS